MEDWVSKYFSNVHNIHCFPANADSFVLYSNSLRFQYFKNICIYKGHFIFFLTGLYIAYFLTFEIIQPVLYIAQNDSKMSY